MKELVSNVKSSVASSTRNERLVITNKGVYKKKIKVTKIADAFRQDYQLYLFVLPAILIVLIFKYFPMYGLQIAFKDYDPYTGYLRSEFVALKHFSRFFSSFNFWIYLKNTILLSLYHILWGFPAPIILAIMINHIHNLRFKKTVQTVTYAPYFISVVVMAGIIRLFVSMNGPINVILEAVGTEKILFMAKPEWFRTIYISSAVWQFTGWGSIIYIGALSTIDPNLYEVAEIDGAGRFQIIRYIDLPAILQTAVTILILNVGNLLNVGFEKVLLLQSSLNRPTSEIISTYVYQMGLNNFEFAFATAVGLFNSLVNVALLLLVNYIAKKLTQRSLLS